MDSARLQGALYQLEHKHGTEWVSLRQHHDSADHDAERSWLRGRRIFRCECGEEVAVTIEDPKDPDR